MGRVAQLAREHACSLAADAAADASAQPAAAGLLCTPKAAPEAAAAAPVPDEPAAACWRAEAGTRQLPVRLSSDGGALWAAPDAPAALPTVAPPASAALAACRAEQAQHLPAPSSRAVVPAHSSVICSSSGGDASSGGNASPAAVEEPTSQSACSLAGTQTLTDPGASSSSPAYSPSSSGDSLTHTAAHAAGSTTLGSGSSVLWQAGVSGATSRCSLSGATDRPSNRSSNVGSYTSSSDGFVSAAGSPAAGSGSPAVGSSSPTAGSGSPAGGSRSPAGSDRPFAGSSSPIAGSSSPFAGSSSQFSSFLGRVALLAHRGTSGAVSPCPADSSQWAAAGFNAESSGAATVRPLAAPAGQPLSLALAAASGADSGSQRLAPRPLPSFCLQQPLAASSSAGAPAVPVGGRAGSIDPPGQEVVADFAAAAPPAAAQLSADGQPGASGTASPAACHGTGSRGDMHGSTAVDRNLTSLQQQLDRCVASRYAHSGVSTPWVLDTRADWHLCCCSMPQLMLQAGKPAGSQQAAARGGSRPRGLCRSPTCSQRHRRAHNLAARLWKGLCDGIPGRRGCCRA